MGAMCAPSFNAGGVNSEHERFLGEVVVAQSEQVEGDEACRGLLGKQRDPAGGRVDALLQRLEVQGVAVLIGDDDLTVDHRAGREVREDRDDDLGKVAGHRPFLAATDLYLVTVAKND